MTAVGMAPQVLVPPILMAAPTARVIPLAPSPNLVTLKLAYASVSQVLVEPHATNAYLDSLACLRQGVRSVPAPLKGPHLPSVTRSLVLVPATPTTLGYSVINVLLGDSTSQLPAPPVTATKLAL